MLHDNLLSRLLNLSISYLKPAVLVLLGNLLLLHLSGCLQHCVPNLHLLALLVLRVADVSQIELDLILPLHQMILQILGAIRRLVVVVPVLVQVEVLETVSIVVNIEAEIVAIFWDVHAAVVGLGSYGMLDCIVDDPLVILTASAILFLHFELVSVHTEVA